ncbi:MAG: hypothetical protein CMN38_03665 [SAR116 cluster bacterium]|nr:hypothetical protein [SAR116 cluster bacterium]
MLMTLKRNRPLVTATISVAALSMLAACGTRPSLVDYRPVVDSYNTNMANYEGERTQCVNVAMQAQAEYDRREKEQRQSNMTVGFIIGAIVGATLGTLEGGLAETDYDPMTSPRKIVDRCMQNRGYEILNDEGKGM